MSLKVENSSIPTPLPYGEMVPMNAGTSYNYAPVKPLTLSEMLRPEWSVFAAGYSTIRSRTFMINSFRPTDAFPDLSGILRYCDDGVLIDNDFVQILRKYKTDHDFQAKQNPETLLWILRVILESTGGWLSIEDFIYVNYGLETLLQTVNDLLARLAPIPAEGHRATLCFSALYRYKFAYIWVPDMWVPDMSVPDMWVPDRHVFRRCQLTDIATDENWTWVSLGFSDQGYQVRKSVLVTQLLSLKDSWILFYK
jgi:hypothetical protein